MITALMAAGMPMTAFAKPDWPSDTGIESEAGIVMDADSGAVLFGQNIHVQKAPASITKILTALVVIENSSLDDTVTFSHDAVYNVEDGSGNKNAIEEGDTLSVRDDAFFQPGGACVGGACGRKPRRFCEDDEREDGGAWL